jgi:hypothetical protein
MIEFFFFLGPELSLVTLGKKSTFWVLRNRIKTTFSTRLGAHTPGCSENNAGLGSLKIHIGKKREGKCESPDFCQY